MKQSGTPPTDSQDHPPKALEVYVVKHNGMGRGSEASEGKAGANPHQRASFLTGTCYTLCRKPGISDHRKEPHPQPTQGMIAHTGKAPQVPLKRRPAHPTLPISDSVNYPR